MAGSKTGTEKIGNNFIPGSADPCQFGIGKGDTGAEEVPGLEEGQETGGARGARGARGTGGTGGSGGTGGVKEMRGARETEDVGKGTVTTVKQQLFVQ